MAERNITSTVLESFAEGKIGTGFVGKQHVDIDFSEIAVGVMAK